MIYSQTGSEIIFTNSIENETIELLGHQKTKIFLLTDSNTIKYCYPLIKDGLPKDHEVFTLPAGEEHKHINSVVKVWNFLNSHGADRKSILINLGGGVLCDLGGFAASTFKRGIDFIHIPTTLLSQVDASVGGKTGINLSSYKNEIGCFSFPIKVIINTLFLNSLDHENLLSGFAEMLKHAFISSEEYYQDLMKIEFIADKIDFTYLLKMVKHSINIKEKVVLSDPMEAGLRKVLNFGHTVGHAFESYYLGTVNEISHGKAVAFGMAVELYLSYLKAGFSKQKLDEIIPYIFHRFGKLDFSPKDYDNLYALMIHDKKNENALINFSFIKDFGMPEINQTANKNEIFSAFDYYLAFSAL
jgi:3-dehydroquinate synthase